ncbi:MAG TPA: hypothetical protein VKT30_08415 [Caulobacteraceae bacterium]|nr:hypothetical protein [Caulobacteraceae bacterium]
MSEIRLALVNGTGPPDPEYDAVMKPSFCSQLGEQLGAKSFYLRGPSYFGTEVREEARAVYRWLKAAHDEDPTRRLMLAGYSRGGSAAIMACEMLERDRVPVDSLFLFDAVARHEYPGGNVIPANVRFSRHARRSLAADFVERYEGTVKGIHLIGGFTNPARPMFGNVGLHWRGDGDHQPAERFLGSHGALGGVGWRIVVEDAACERDVAAWMNGHLTARGVDVALTPYQPTGDAVRVTHPSHFEKWLTHNIYQFVLHHDEPHLSHIGPYPDPGVPQQSDAARDASVMLRGSGGAAS